jgi:hypothetical protein
MAHDLIFGRTRRNWSRGSCLALAPITSEAEFRLTPPEMAMLADLAATKMRADGGDRAAQKKIAQVIRKVASLKARSKKGDAIATRTLKVLNESGVFRGTQSFSMGAELQIPNITYRAAVLRQAAKASGGKRPTTKDFFRAKSAIDKVMGKAGISLFLPGSRPGRITA